MGYNQRNNPFSRRASSPLNQNGPSSDPNLLKPIPTWKTEEEQATMKADDPGGYYNWLTDMQAQEEKRIKEFEKKVGDYALSTAENTKGRGFMPKEDLIEQALEHELEGYDYPITKESYDWARERAESKALPWWIQKGKAGSSDYRSAEEGGFDHAAIFRENFPGTYRQVENTPRQYACNSYTCSIASESGATMPRDMNRDGVVDEKDVYKIWEGGKEYRGGDAWPVLPGTAQFNIDRDNFGMTLTPAGTTPDPNKVQFIRKSSRDRVFPADGHSILSTGIPNPDNPEIGTHIEGAGLYSGPNLGDHYMRPRAFVDADGDGHADSDWAGDSYRIMNYEGDLPYFRTKLEQMAPWKAEQDRIEAEEKAAAEAARKADMKQIMSLGL